MTRVLSTSSCSVALALLVSSWSSAHAQAPEATDPAGAMPILQQGVEAFSANDYQRALELFERAYAIAPLPALKFNIALCYERLGRYTRALAEYEAALAAPSLDEEGRARGRTQIERVGRRIGTLVFSGPAGATVDVDGEARCTLPCELRVDPGARVVRLDAVPPVTRRVRAAPGERTRVSLVPHFPEREDRDDTPPRTRDGLSLSFLTWLGAGLAVAAGACIVGFGVHTHALESEYASAPSEALANEGELYRGLRNGSIGVALGGVVLVAVDLILALTVR